jgi:hypothetical protein
MDAEDSWTPSIREGIEITITHRRDIKFFHRRTWAFFSTEYELVCQARR